MKLHTYALKMNDRPGRQFVEMQLDIDMICILCWFYMLFVLIISKMDSTEP